MLDYRGGLEKKKKQSHLAVWLHFEGPFNITTESLPGEKRIDGPVASRLVTARPDCVADHKQACEQPMRRQNLFCRKLAIADVVLVVVVIAILGIVTFHCLHVGFVEYCTEKGFVNVWCRMKRMLNNAGRGASPFHHQNKTVDERRRRANVNNRCEWRKIDDNIFIRGA